MDEPRRQAGLPGPSGEVFCPSHLGAAEVERELEAEAPNSYPASPTRAPRRPSRLDIPVLRREDVGELKLYEAQQIGEHKELFSERIPEDDRAAQEEIWQKILLLVPQDKRQQFINELIECPDSPVEAKDAEDRLESIVRLSGIDFEEEEEQA